MKKKYIIYALLPALGIALAAAGSVAARGPMGMKGGFSAVSPDQFAVMHQTRFAEEANLLGVNVDVVKEAWAQGKNLFDLATERGITKEQLQEKMKVARATQMKEHMQTLVSKGVITQTQADSRLKAMETMGAKMKQGKGMHGFGKMMGK
jgi:hypothetical protein